MNKFDINGYHPFKGWYPYGLKISCNGNLISESLYFLVSTVSFDIYSIFIYPLLCKFCIKTMEIVVYAGFTGVYLCSL
jgi:hypothetical protein